MKIRTIKKSLSPLLTMAIMLLCLNPNAGAQSIHDAVKANNINDVKALLEQNPDLANSLNDEKVTPLILACGDTNVDGEIIKLLIEAKADLNQGDQDRDTPLHYAAFRGNLKAVKMLVENGTEIDAKDVREQTPLHLAIYGQHSDIAKYLVENKADINAIVYYTGFSPLFLALNVGDESLAEALISAGASIDVRDNNGRLPLYAALEKCATKIVGQLLDATPNIDLDRDGDFLIGAAISCKNNRLIDLLVAQGLDISKPDPIGQTLMYKAANNGMVALMKSLYEKGLSLDSKDVYGQHPIHTAAIAGQQESIRFLVENGAKINATTPLGKTAWHLVMENEHSDAQNLLVELGVSQEQWKFPKLKPSYLGQKPPKDEPQLFGPGIISTQEGFEYAISFHPKGKELLLSRRVPEHIYDNNRLYMMNLEKRNWSDLKLAPFAEDYKSGEAVYSPDGRYIIFGSTRPNTESAEGEFDAWIVDYDRSKVEPMLLPEPFEDPQFLMYISSTSKNKIYFTSNGGTYSAAKTDTGYEEAIFLGGNINGPSEGKHPFIAPDESYMIFDAEDRIGGFGETDLYISFKNDDGSWTKAQNLGGKINSSAGELCASVSSDGKYLFFHSERNGNGDIYWVDTSFIKELKKKARAKEEGIFDLQYQTLGNSRSFSIKHGDLNNDGYQDILMVNYFSPSRIWFNNGDNTFKEMPDNINTKAGEEHGGGIADLDNDGDLDIVIVTTGQGENKVHLNDGTGNFVNPDGQFLTKGAGYGHIYLKDADSDGDLDAFLINYNQSNELWLNDGNAQFVKTDQAFGGENSRTMAVDDLDGDGDVDVFLTVTDAPEEVWLNDGNGSFEKLDATLDNLDGMESVTLADFDDDGDLDAAVANLTHGITLWLNDGKANFQSMGVTFSHSRDINSADIDNDGDIDLYASDRINGDVVFLNNGSANFSETDLINEISLRSGFVDIDNDGDLDLIVSKMMMFRGHTVYVNRTIR